jgi:two-component sensor histidine kinase
MSGMGDRFASIVASMRPSPAVIAVYAVASIIGGLISVTSAAGPAWKLILLSGVVTGIVVALLVASNWLPWGKLGDRPVISSALFIGVAMVVGLLRGLAFVQLADVWGIGLSSDDATQILNSTVSAIVWLTLAGLVIGGRDRYRGRYRALLLQGDIDVDWDQHPSVEQIKRNLGTALSRSDTSVHVDPSQVADAIRREIDTNIRPLSHRLWFGAEEEEPRSRLFPLVRDAVTSWTVPTRAVAIVWFFTAILGGARWLGFEQGLMASVVSTVLIVSVIVVIGRWIPASPWWRVGALAFGSVVVVITTDGVLRLSGYPSRLYLDTGSLLLLPVTVFALVVVAAAITLVESDRRTILEVAERESRELGNAKRQSTFLHNSLQSELTGMALQLDEAARTGSAEESRAALERVHALLARSISEEFASFQENPRERIDRIVGGWRGICEVSIEFDEPIHDDPRLGAAVQAIEEIITNAVRHASATSLRATISSSARGMVILVESDTRVVAEGEAGAGLGSRVLASMAPEGIVIKGDGSGSRLELVIP